MIRDRRSAGVLFAFGLVCSRCSDELELGLGMALGLPVSLYVLGMLTVHDSALPSPQHNNNPAIKIWSHNNSALVCLPMIYGASFSFWLIYRLCESLSWGNCVVLVVVVVCGCRCCCCWLLFLRILLHSLKGKLLSPSGKRQTTKRVRLGRLGSFDWQNPETRANAKAKAKANRAPQLNNRNNNNNSHTNKNKNSAQRSKTFDTPRLEQLAAARRGRRVELLLLINNFKCWLQKPQMNGPMNAWLAVWRTNGLTDWLTDGQRPGASWSV